MLFLERYNHVNTMDAPNWIRGAEAIRALNGMSAARMEVAFNNATALRTRDYIFFGPDKTAIVQNAEWRC